MRRVPRDLTRSRTPTRAHWLRRSSASSCRAPAGMDARARRRDRMSEQGTRPPRDGDANVTHATGAPAGARPGSWFLNPLSSLPYRQAVPPPPHRLPISYPWWPLCSCGRCRRHAVSLELCERVFVPRGKTPHIGIGCRGASKRATPPRPPALPMRALHTPPCKHVIWQRPQSRRPARWWVFLSACADISHERQSSSPQAPERD